MGEVNDFGMSYAQSVHDAQEPPEREPDMICDNCGEDTGDDTGMCDDCAKVAPAGESALAARKFIRDTWRRRTLTGHVAAGILDEYENFLAGLGQEAKLANQIRDEKRIARRLEVGQLQAEFDALPVQNEADQRKVALFYFLLQLVKDA